VEGGGGGWLVGRGGGGCAPRQLRCRCCVRGLIILAALSAAGCATSTRRVSSSSSSSKRMKRHTVRTLAVDNHDHALGVFSRPEVGGDLMALQKRLVGGRGRRGKGWPSAPVRRSALTVRVFTYRSAAVFTPISTCCRLPNHPTPHLPDHAPARS